MLRIAAIFLLAALMAAPLKAAEDVKVMCSQDTFLQKGITGKPGGRGTMPEVKLMLSPPDSANYETLLQFSDIPRVYFKSARLRLHVLNMALGANPGKIEVHRVTVGWDEKNASEDAATAATKWTKDMGDFDPKVSGICDLSLLPATNSAILLIDITDLVRDWQAKPDTNFGMILVLSPGSTADLRIVSKDDASDKTKESWPTLYLTDRPVLKPGDVDLDFQTSELFPCKTNVPVSVAIKAFGGKPPYTFTAEGILPRGMTLGKDGKFAGTPTMPGHYSIRVKLEDTQHTELTHDYKWEVDKGSAEPPGPPGPGGQPANPNQPKQPNTPNQPKQPSNLPNDDG